MGRLSVMRTSIALLVGALVLLSVGAAGAAAPPNVRLSNDDPAGGYVSAYTLATGEPHTDATLDECSQSRGRQNEPADEIDPRNDQVILGSSNDYCGVYNDGVDQNGAPIPSGPIWLGYYRSENGGASFTSSLVPGYPDDTSPYAALAQQVRTSSAGDPVIAWDNHGRAFFGSEASGDPAGSKKTFGDEWVARFRNPQGETGPTSRDGLEYYGTTVVAKGSAAPNLLGVFNDKTAIEADRTGGACDGYVYFTWSRFTGNSNENDLDFVRSTDHGVTFSRPLGLTSSFSSVQDPDISVTGNGHVYVTYRSFASKQSHTPDAIQYVKSTDCGATFSRPRTVVTFEPYDAQDVAGPQPTPAQTGQDDPPSAESGDTAAQGSLARDCGDFADACQSGYTFFRHTTTPRSTADQSDKQHEWIYIVYDPSKPGTEVSTGTTYGSITPGTGSQEAVYFTRLDGATGSHTTPVLVDDQPFGHQLFADIAVNNGVLHTLWWDSRNDTCYSPTRPIGNCADGSTMPALDVFASTSTNAGASWSSPATQVTNFTSNGNYEQFDGRAVPFGGDYLWISSAGSTTFGTWTDWRDTVAGPDQRETEGSNDLADVLQCRTLTSSGAFTGDTCPRDGGLDQNIYGATIP
jgi:hypothetical protein